MRASMQRVISCRCGFSRSGCCYVFGAATLSMHVPSRSLMALRPVRSFNRPLTIDKIVIESSNRPIVGHVAQTFSRSLTFCPHIFVCGADATVRPCAKLMR